MPTPHILLTLTLALLTLLLTASLRLLFILRPRPTPRRTSPARVLIVLGSGGHTHEMLHLLRNLDTRRYAHRTYVVSSGDAFSAGRAAVFERGLEEDTQGRKGNGDGGNTGPKSYVIVGLPRARRVHQSLLSTPFSALRTLLSTLALLAREPPDLILTNGPATGAMIVLAAFVLRFFDVRGVHSRGKGRTIYVESFARVKGLSLSARVVGWGVDRLVVQWEGLARGRAEFWGVLV